MFFDALGRLALGQITRSGQVTTTLVAEPGVLSLAGQAITFELTESVEPGVLSLSPVVSSAEIFDTAEIGSLSLSSPDVTFETFAPVEPGVLTTSGSLSFALFEPVGTAELSLTPIDAKLWRTGADFDLVYGGVGHYLEELERQRQLARITRTIPPPIDRRTIPRFAPLQASPVAPSAPVADLAAMQNERMVTAAAAADAAKKRRRRDEEALLLLAC